MSVDFCNACSLCSEQGHDDIMKEDRDDSGKWCSEQRHDDSGKWCSEQRHDDSMNWDGDDSVKKYSEHEHGAILLLLQ